MTTSVINSDNGVVSGTSGIKTTGGDDGALNIQSNGTNMLELSAGVAAVKGTASGGAALRLYEDTDNGTNYVGLVAPASVASNLSLTLPSADGTSGQFLQTNGSGGLSFADAGGGAWNLLSTTTANNSATVNVETGFGATYDHYVIVATGITSQSAGEIYVRMKLGGSYASSNYGWSRSYPTFSGSAYSGSSSGGFSGTSTDIIMTETIRTTDSRDNCSFVMWVHDVNQTTQAKLLHWRCSMINAANDTGYNISGSAANLSTSALSGIRFYFSSGNMVTGTFYLYGISK